MVDKARVRAAAYLRVSTLLGQDPENQRVPIEQHARERGWKVVEIYCDRGHSGAKDRRPALDQLLADARSGRFNVLLIAAIDRLARDTRHLLNVVYELDKQGVALISLREQIDLTTPVGRMLVTMLGAVASLERETIRERIRVALAVRKAAAVQSGSGWRCGRPRTVTLDLEVRARELRNQGMSVRQIKRALGGVIGTTSISKILRNAPPPTP